MILQTGGLAFGEISTKSNSESIAICMATEVLKIPGSIFSPTNRTSGTLISELILCKSFFTTGTTGPLVLLIAMAVKF